MHVSALPESVTGTQPVRVMIVDDSTVVRGLLLRWVEAEPGFIVVGTAVNGRQAVEIVQAARPDIVLLDLEMPELDGFAALPLLLSRLPGLSVVVVSTLTARSADIALRCLAKGADDYVTKPEARIDLTGSATFRQELIGKLRALASSTRNRTPRLPSRRPAVRAGTAPDPRSWTGQRSRAVLIGASTGGPRAVIEMLAGLRRTDFGAAILIVQHMPAVFTGVFAEHIQKETGFAAAEAVHGETLTAGRVYIAPGGRHMGLSPGTAGAAIRIDDSEPINHCRPAVDLLFRDGAAIFGPAALGIVLTGMGHDGTDGARAILEGGGTTIAQDEETSTVWGMPGSLARHGLARQILPLGAIASAVDAKVSGRPQ